MLDELNPFHYQFYIILSYTTLYTVKPHKSGLIGDHSCTVEWKSKLN